VTPATGVSGEDDRSPENDRSLEDDRSPRPDGVDARFRPRADIAAAIAAENAAVEELYENAPCGYLSTLPDGTIVKINATLLGWLGHHREDLVGRRRFTDLLTVGGRIYYETHFAPLMSMQNSVGEVAVDLATADGRRIPVLVTAALNAGNEHGPAVVRCTVFDAHDRRAYERELLRARQDADRERERVQRLATVLQRSLLPPQLPTIAGMETAAYYHPASLDEVGGDFYDLFPLSQDTWGFFLGDVCGKGAMAAALTSLIRYTLRTAAARDPDPIHVLTELNRVLVQKRPEEKPEFCTVLLGLLEPDENGAALTLATGGHTPALVLRADGAAHFCPLPQGQLVGIVPDAHFTGAELRLDAGDALLLYTDGLTEARIDPERGRYNEDKLQQFVTDLAPARAPKVVQALIDLLAGFGDGLDDDVAILAIGIPPDPDTPFPPPRGATSRCTGAAERA
jgi:sigma-B regulation protein RsbU (phosphoserine phosphatase)